MYSINSYPGKFEGNSSQLLAEVVYRRAGDGFGQSLGDVDTFGFFTYVQGKRYGFIMQEDSQGFVDVDVLPKALAQVKWNEIEVAYATYCDANPEADF